jgi:O-antigen ligase
MAELIILSLLVWLPVLLHQISRRGLAVLLIWIFIAPIVLNIIDKPQTNPLFGQRTRLEQVSQNQGERQKQAAALSAYDKSASVSWKDILDPTRALFALFLTVFFLEAAIKRKRLLPLDRTEIWMLSFVVILILSSLLQSLRWGNGLRIAIDAFFVPFLAYYITRRLVTSEEDLRKLTVVMGYLGLYLVLTAVLERLTVPGLLYRLSGPFGTDNELNSVMIAIFFLLLTETGRGRFGGAMVLPHGLRWSLICLIPVVIVLTWARSNWLAFLAGAWVFMFLGRRLVPISQRLAAIGLLFLLLCLIGVGVQALTPGEEIEGRVAKVSSIYSRLGAWQLAIGEGLEHPIFGIGLKNVEYVLLAQRSSFMGVRNVTDVHNGFLTIFVEHGVAGLFVYGAIMATILNLGLNLYRRGAYPQDRWRGVTIISVLIAYLTPILTTTILHVPTVSHVYVFATVGGIAGLYKGSWQKISLPIRRTVAAKRVRHWQRVLSS